MIFAPPALQAPQSAPASVVKVVSSVAGSLGVERTGSGVVVALGIVATNAHILQGSSGLHIHSGGRTWHARVRFVDPSRDLALLDVTGLDLPPAHLADQEPAEGAPLTSWGYPFGQGPRATTGFLALGWSYQGARLLQAELASAPGNSGGGLFDASGRLVGLTTFVLNRHPKAAFAVPVDWIRAMLSATNEGSATTGDEVTLLRDFLGRMMAEPDNLQGWLRLTERWTRESPADPEAWSARARALQRDLATRDFDDPKDRLRAAQLLEAVLRTALSLDPTQARLWRSLGQVLDLQSRAAEAEAAFIEALDRDRRDAAAWAGLGAARFTLKQHEKAATAFLSATDLAPDYARAWALRAANDTELKRLDDAQEHWRIAVNLLPIRTTWILSWAQIALRRHDRPTAEAALQKLETLQAPEAKELRKALGR